MMTTMIKNIETSKLRLLQKKVRIIRGGNVASIVQLLSLCWHDWVSKTSSSPRDCCSTDSLWFSKTLKNPCISFELFKCYNTIDLRLLLLFFSGINVVIMYLKTRSEYFAGKCMRMGRTFAMRNLIV